MRLHITLRLILGFRDTNRVVWHREMDRGSDLGVHCSAVRFRDFVFAYAKSRFSNDAAHMVETNLKFHKHAHALFRDP